MAPVFILSETSAGYALFKSSDKKLLKRTDLAEKTRTAEDACELLKLKEFRKFDNATIALNEAAAIGDGKVTPMLTSFLSSLADEKKASLAVADAKLANAINKIPSLSLNLVSDSNTNDLYRAIREHLPSLITGLTPKDIDTMNLGLSHSLSRHKLKFSADKVDTMIIQAIALLDDLDKELNQYAMRVKEWYGWHFPEMARIINDNVAYARVVLTMGMRSNASSTDLSDVLPEEIEGAVKAAAEVSMGTEITPDDLENIQALAEQVVEFTEYRSQLSSYLSNRMRAIAPNLTALVGDLVGARLIAHAGSLTNLSKSPASTIQILGAEKALFRALKTKHDTPKYGLIYHASLIGQAPQKLKGKMARMTATKAALSIRVDALSDADSRSDAAASEVGVTNRVKLESRLRALEHRAGIQSVRKTTTGTARPTPRFDMQSGSGGYNANADNVKVEVGTVQDLLPTQPKEIVEEVVKVVQETKEEKRKRKEEKKAKRQSVGAAAGAGDVTMDGDDDAVEGETKEERKARKEAKKAAKAAKKAAAENGSTPTANGSSESKKKRSADAMDGEDGEKKKKKKKRDSAAA